MSFTLNNTSIPINSSKINDFNLILSNILQNPTKFSPIELTDAYLRCGIVYFYNGSYNEAIHNFNISFNIKKDFLSNNRIDSYCYLLLGLAYIRICDIKQAEISFIKSVNIAKVLPNNYNNIKLLTYALDNLALIRMNLKNYIDAVEAVNESIRLTNKSSDDYLKHIRILISIYVKMNVFTKVEDIVNHNDFDPTEKALLIAGCKFASGNIKEARKILMNTKYFDPFEIQTDDYDNIDDDMLYKAQVKYNLTIIDMKSNNYNNKSYISESISLLHKYIDLINQIQRTNSTKISNQTNDIFNYNPIDDSTYPNIISLDNIIRPYIMLTQMIVISIEFELLNSISYNSIDVKIANGFIVKDSNNMIDNYLEDKIDDGKIDNIADNTVDNNIDSKLDIMIDDDSKNVIEIPLDNGIYSRINDSNVDIVDQKVDRQLDNTTDSKDDCKSDTKSDSKINFQIDNKLNNENNSELDLKADNKIDSDAVSQVDDKADGKPSDRFTVKEYLFYQNLLDQLDRILDILNVDTLSSYSKMYNNNQLLHQNSMDDSIDSRFGNKLDKNVDGVIDSSIYDITITYDMIVNYQQLIRQLLVNQIPIDGKTINLSIQPNNNIDSDEDRFIYQKIIADETLQVLYDRYNQTIESTNLSTRPINNLNNNLSDNVSNNIITNQSNVLSTSPTKSPVRSPTKSPRKSPLRSTKSKIINTLSTDEIPNQTNNLITHPVSNSNSKYNSEIHDINSIRSELLPLITSYGRDDITLWIVWAISNINGIGYGTLGIGTQFTVDRSINILNTANVKTTKKSTNNLNIDTNNKLTNNLSIDSSSKSINLTIDTTVPIHLSTNFLRLLYNRLLLVDKQISDNYESNQSVYISNQAECRYIVNLLLIKVLYYLNLKRDINKHILLIDNLAKYYIKNIIYLAIVKRYQLQYEEYVSPTLGPDKRFVYLCTTLLPLCKEYVKLTDQCSDLTIRLDSYKRIINVYIEISKLPVSSNLSTTSLSSSSVYSNISINSTKEIFASLDKLETFYKDEDIEILESNNMLWLKEFSKARAKQWMKRLRLIDSSTFNHNRQRAL